MKGLEDPIAYYPITPVVGSSSCYF